jgi:hypothetical protein
MPTPRLLWLMVCQTSVVDARTGNYSLMEVIESINLPAPVFLGSGNVSWPALFVPAKAVCIFEWDWPVKSKREPVRLIFRVKMPTGEIVTPEEDHGFEMQPPPEDSSRTRVEWLFNKFPVTDPGIYEIELALADEVIASYPLGLLAFELPAGFVVNADGTLSSSTADLTPAR